MRQRFFRMIGLGIKQFRDPYYQGFAAQMAFYYMLSLVPTALLLSQLLLAIFKTDVQDLADWILDAVGGRVGDQIYDLIAYRSAGAVNAVYILVALWAASRAQFSFARIANFTLTDGRTTGNGYWRERFRAIFTMFLMIVAILVAVIIMVYGGQLIELFFKSQRIWLYVRWPVAFAMFFLVLSFVYHILPSERLKYRQVVPGSIFSSIGLVLITYLYATYINRVAQYDIVYGALANIVALMFWFYFVSWVLCLGVLFNKVMMDTADGGGGSAFE